MGKRKSDIRKAKAREARKTTRKDNVKVNQGVAVGKWTDVRRGQVVAEGTYIDGQGVLRDAKDGSVATWHVNEKTRRSLGLTGPCVRRGIAPAEIAYDPETGAPWCPECWPVEQKRRQKEKLEQEFNDLVESFNSIPLIGDELAKAFRGLFAK